LAAGCSAPSLERQFTATSPLGRIDSQASFCCPANNAVPACSTSTCVRLSSRLHLPVNTSTLRLGQLKRRLVQPSYQVRPSQAHAHVHTHQAGSPSCKTARARAAEKPEQCSAFWSATSRVPYLLDAREDAGRPGPVKGPTSDAGAGSAVIFD
jgi:hypothetical protein